MTDVLGYAEGEFIVQDPGTALAVELMDVKPGDVVLDACAAPGEGDGLRGESEAPPQV